MQTRQNSFAKYFAALIAADQSHRTEALSGILRMELARIDPSLQEPLSFIYKNKDLWPEKGHQIDQKIPASVFPLFRDLEKKYSSLYPKIVSDFDSQEFRVLLEKAMISGQWYGKIGNA